VGPNHVRRPLVPDINDRHQLGVTEYHPHPAFLTAGSITSRDLEVAVAGSRRHDWSRHGPFLRSSSTSRRRVCVISTSRRRPCSRRPRRHYPTSSPSFVHTTATCLIAAASHGLRYSVSDGRAPPPPYPRTINNLVP